MVRQDSRWAWLRSQGLGICCGLATTLLLAVGSFVIAATRGGASAGVRLDDIRVFFRSPSPAHLWLYLLLPVLGLYGLNTALATWHSVTAKWRSGFRDPQTYAAAFLHVAFLVALFAHLVGGVAGEDRGLLLDGSWRALPDGREARVLSVDVERLPDGMPRTMRATVELRSADGPVDEAVIGFNEPLSGRLGADLLLFQRPVAVPVAVLAAAGERCSLRPGERCRLGGRDVRLADLRDSGAHGMLAQVVSGERTAWLARDMAQTFTDGFTVSLVKVERQAGAVFTWRRAPGNPWALLATVFIVFGVGLMWRRFV